MIRRGRALPAVAVAALISVLSGCGLQAFNWDTNIFGGEVQFAGVEDAKSDIHAARAAVNCRDHDTGATYQQRGSLVDIDTGAGLYDNTNTFWSVVRCAFGDARVSNVGIVVVRRG